MRLPGDSANWGGWKRNLDRKVQGWRFAKKKKLNLYFTRVPLSYQGFHSNYDIFHSYSYIHISNLLSGDRDRIEVVGHSIKSRVDTILVWIEVENFYPTSNSQLKDSINESNAQSRVVSRVKQDTIQQSNAQCGLGRDYPAIKPLACIRAETIQLVCNRGTPSTSNARSQVETIHFLAVNQGISSN